MSISAQIQKVLISGTAHQRATLLANHIGLWITPNEPATLTDEERSALDDSFRTELDRKVYRKFKMLDDLFRFRLIGLSQVRMEYELVSTKIFFFDYSKFQFRDVESLLCEIGELVIEKCGEDTQIAIWKKIAKSGSFPMDSKIKLTIGEEGAYISFRGATLSTKGIIPNHKKLEALERGDTDMSYDSCIKGCGEQLNRLRSITKTFIDTLRGVMQKNSFHIRPYKKFLDEIEAKVREEPQLTSIMDVEGEKSSLDSIKDKKFRDRFKKRIEEAQETRRHFFTPYDETELDLALEKMLLEEFDHKAIND